ncbi:MAG: hypothetical protein LUG15_06675 [Oscillospiraceae bacterium]|nr:hypothetical protein [Oscillospiraceae bacterium]
MTDYLDVTLSEQALNAVSNLGLAHIGDCVYELLVRTYLLCGGERTNRRLHAATVAYVSASAQAAAMEKLLPHLTEAESAVYCRGRNAHVHSVPSGRMWQTTMPPRVWNACSAGSICAENTSGSTNCFKS